MRFPGAGVTPTRIFIGDPRIEWEPASLPQNKAKITFKPGLQTPLEDSGEDSYTLMIQSRDARGNQSGQKTEYQVTFRVVNAHTISNILNYPNPFSTSTRFAYILTGNELPTFFQIHIFTITGKLVKVIDLAELGDIHFGKNVTEYAWDGTDEYGDKLGNGVYLYRVVMKMDKNQLEESKEDDKTDKYFKTGWGKMYLMR
jgi:flagellar hook assembly protein FlgD